jgi:uncharacterized lipoprotein YmbA
MSMTMQKSFAVLALLLLAGCKSPETSFYSLSVVRESGAVEAAIPFPVQLSAVHMPPSLDRRQLVRMASENRVDIEDTERWSASLDEMVLNVLSQDLAERLPERSVILPAAPPPSGTGTLVVTIAEFGSAATGEVRLHGSWALLSDGSETPRLERDFRIAAGTASSADEMAAAMSRALGELASAIVADLSHSGISNEKAALGR